MAEKSTSKAKISSELLSSSSTGTTSGSVCSQDGEDSDVENHGLGRISETSIFTKSRQRGSAKISSLGHGLNAISRSFRQNAQARRLDPVVKWHETGSSTVLSGSW